MVECSEFLSTRRKLSRYRTCLSRLANKPSIVIMMMTVSSGVTDDRM